MFIQWSLNFKIIKIIGIKILENYLKLTLHLLNINYMVIFYGCIVVQVIFLTMKMKSFWKLSTRIHLSFM